MSAASSVLYKDFTARQADRISWNGDTPKYDIREWAPNREKMGKGVTLSEEDFKALKGLLNQI